MKIYQIMTVNILLCGSHNWDVGMIQASEVKILRYVKGCTLENRNRNEDMRGCK